VLVLGIDQLRRHETRLFGAALLTNLVVGFTRALLLLQTDIEGCALYEMFGAAVFSILTLLFAARLLGVVEPVGDYARQGSERRVRHGPERASREPRTTSRVISSGYDIRDMESATVTHVTDASGRFLEHRHPTPAGHGRTTRRAACRHLGGV